LLISAVSFQLASKLQVNLLDLLTFCFSGKVVMLLKYDVSEHFCPQNDTLDSEKGDFFAFLFVLS
jgi:hypothetical protein